MNFVAVFMTVFSMLGALDRIFGNRFKLGREFERGFMLFGNLALSMIGMIIISPIIADILRPALDVMYDVFHVDPSILPAVLFANDMGGASLGTEVAKNADIGLFNGLVVSSMMGCTISFTIPYALSVVEPEHHRQVLLGLLCGIVTIPLGSFVSGLVLGLPLPLLAIDLLPLVIFSALIACGLIFCPAICVKIFDIFGIFIKILITVGLAFGILRYLTGVEVIAGLDTLENGAAICLNASAVMSGAFPFVYIVSKLIAKPLRALGAKIGVNDTSALGLVSTLATCMTTFEMVRKMDDRGIVLNSAFAISATSTFAGHLAFTLAFNPDYIFPVIVGKLVAGLTALVVAYVVYQKKHGAIEDN